MIASSRSAGKAGRLRTLGAEPIALDVLDAAAVHAAVQAARPEAIVCQATALAGAGFSRSLDRTFALTNRLRTEGTDNVLAAARQAGVRRIVAQSFAPYRYLRVGGPVKTEDDPLDGSPPASARQSFAAMAHLDQTVIAAGGIALRYGGFYGDPDQLVTAVRKRQYPIVGDSAASCRSSTWTTRPPPPCSPSTRSAAVYNITDDEPAVTRDWLRCSLTCSGPSRRGTCPPGWPG